MKGKFNIYNVYRNWVNDCNKLDRKVTADVMEFLGPVECKMTTDGRGRGLFASRDLKKGEFIIVEKPFADSKYPDLSEKELMDFSVLYEVKVAKGNQNIKLIYDLLRKMKLKKRWLAQAM